MEIENKKVSMNYEAECERLKEQIQGNSEFYGEVIKRKDEEIEWYKKIIEKMLHM